MNWIDVKDKLPDMGWFWGQCYDGLDGDAYVDDDYEVTHYAYLNHRLLILPGYTGLIISPKNLTTTKTGFHFSPKKIQLMKEEQNLQLQICQYLRLQYPKAIFFSEPSGLRVSIGQAKLLKKMRSFGKLPDMFIAYPNDKYHGFFIELKKEGTTIWKKNGELVADPHIRSQFNTLKTLHELGYAAIFGIGFEYTRAKIDSYFAMNPMPVEQQKIDFENK